MKEENRNAVVDTVVSQCQPSFARRISMTTVLTAVAFGLGCMWTMYATYTSTTRVLMAVTTTTATTTATAPQESPMLSFVAVPSLEDINVKEDDGDHSSNLIPDHGEEEEKEASMTSTKQQQRSEPLRIQESIVEENTATASSSSFKFPTSPTAHYQGIETGILSTRESTFFRSLQAEIDVLDNVERCARYGYTYDTSKKQRRLRKVYFGALVAAEPWEVWHIAAAEAFGIYDGMVLVEGNRTQNLTPRQFRQIHQGPIMAHLFGVPEHRVQVRAFVNEDGLDKKDSRTELANLDREHLQREEILKGWKELGMTGDDIGFLADADEVLTRDFVRALQTCNDIVQFDYDKHQCRHEHVKILTTTRIFEGSPECITRDREGWHPEVMIGHCLAGIGDASKHPDAPRDAHSALRAPGFGKQCTDWEGEQNITDGRYPLWNAADLRRTCGGAQIRVKSQSLSTTSTSPVSNATAPKQQQQQQQHQQPPKQLFDKYTAFHFHNFFAHLNHTRFKYQTYGHADPNATSKALYQLSDDLHLMYKCVLNESDATFPHDASRKVPFRRVDGGFDQAQAFLPIYFYDADYRRRRHDHVRYLVLTDQERYEPNVQTA